MQTQWKVRPVQFHKHEKFSQVFIGILNTCVMVAGYLPGVVQRIRQSSHEPVMFNSQSIDTVLEGRMALHCLKGEQHAQINIVLHKYYPSFMKKNK